MIAGYPGHKVFSSADDSKPGVVNFEAVTDGEVQVRLFFEWSPGDAYEVSDRLREAADRASGRKR